MLSKSSRSDESRNQRTESPATEGFSPIRNSDPLKPN